MPISHLLRAPGDKWVYDSVRFFRHCRWQRATAYALTLCTAIVQFLVPITCVSTWRQSEQSHTETVWRSYGNPAMPMQIPQIRHPCGLCIEAVRRWCGDCARAIQMPQELTIGYGLCRLIASQM